MAQRFEIYALDVGAGKESGQLAIAPLPGAGGSLHADLRSIADWGATHVVSLTEADEMTRLGADALPAALAAEGITWLHFPVPDFDVPSADLSEDWHDHERALRRALMQGARVLMHCRGGCGRSGMLMLRLMIALGEAPDTALARLRAIRPCAVETEAQMHWATAETS